MVILLFVLDIAMTIEAALYSDIVLIALLHVITIPVFFALIYLDLVQQHKTKFRCFICGRNILEEEKAETVRRTVGGQKKRSASTPPASALRVIKGRRFQASHSKKEYLNNPQDVYATSEGVSFWGFSLSCLAFLRCSPLASPPLRATARRVSVSAACNPLFWWGASPPALATRSLVSLEAEANPLFFAASNSGMA